MISLLICVNICFIFYFIFVVDFMFAIVSKFQLFQIKMLSTIIWTICKTEPNAQRHRSDWNLVIEFNFFEAEKTNLIPSMADRLSSFHWRAFYKCVYCNKDYDALKITRTQLGRCPDCLNYNTPERSVSCFFRSSLKRVNDFAKSSVYAINCMSIRFFSFLMYFQVLVDGKC